MAENKNSMKIGNFVIYNIIFSLICALEIVLSEQISSIKLRDNLIKLENEQIVMQEFINSMKYPQYDSFSFKPCLKEDIGTNTILKSYDVRYYSEPDARNILIKYFTDLLDKQETYLEESSITLKTLLFSEAVSAFEFDLNNDGVNEILGLVKSWKYYNQYGTMPFFVLQKQGDEYKEIGLFQYRNEQKIVIFKEQINGYYNMQFRNDDFIPCERFQYDESFYISMSFQVIYVPH